MKFFALFYSLVFCLEFSETLFLFPEKHAIFLCLKVCPLYCSKRQRRDTGEESYWDSDVTFDWPPSSIEEEEDQVPYYSYHPYHVGRWVYCIPCRPSHSTTKKPTTTKKPSTTTEKPTWICEVCQKKCGAPKS